MSERLTNSGVSKRLIRRLMKATGWNYTTCLRYLEQFPENAREWVATRIVTLMLNSKEN